MQHSSGYKDIKNKLSVVIITKNEAINIESCLISIRDIADEVIIADSHSTDNTVELATRLGAKVHLIDWLGYAKTRNLAASFATSDWILMLDADETLNANALDFIEQLKMQTDLQDWHYAIQRVSCYLGKWIKHGAWAKDLKFRLYNRQMANWTGEYVHEVLQLNVQNIKVVSLPTNANILHRPFQSITEHAISQAKYAQLSAEEALGKGKTTTALNVIMKPAFYFIKEYVVQMGWRDGKPGLILAYMSGYYRFLKYGIIWTKQNKKGQ
ncbi:MAG: glycosyltransferase family 2 protein [Bacteroidota bacterium]|nr:glycosyltransferase family 2 protein [Bacteroidota bacterium]